MSTIGLYFGLTQEAANALRRRLNELFGRLGYATETSANASRKRRKPWSGGLPKGLVALDRGELVVVKVPLEAQAVIVHLRESTKALKEDFGKHADYIIAALLAHAEALEQAVRRQENVVKEDD